MNIKNFFLHVVVLSCAATTSIFTIKKTEKIIQNILLVKLYALYTNNNSQSINCSKITLYRPTDGSRLEELSLYTNKINKSFNPNAKEILTSKKNDLEKEIEDFFDKNQINENLKVKCIKAQTYKIIIEKKQPKNFEFSKIEITPAFIKDKKKIAYYFHQDCKKSFMKLIDPCKKNKPKELPPYLI
ncbi:hypothetical protein KAH94_02140 [bacterium]|nr:hypothetical protein [bacterium]